MARPAAWLALVTLLRFATAYYEGYSAAHCPEEPRDAIVGVQDPRLYFIGAHHTGTTTYTSLVHNLIRCICLPPHLFLPFHPTVPPVLMPPPGRAGAMVCRSSQQGMTFPGATGWRRCGSTHAWPIRAT